MEGPKIGVVENVRAKCPDCKSESVHKIGVESFPEAQRAMVEEASKQADFYQCFECRKRWAVVRVTREQVAGLMDDPGAAAKAMGITGEKKPAAGFRPSRRARRADEAHGKRLLEKNRKLAGEVPAVSPAPVVDLEEKRRERNVRKKARQGQR